MDFTITNHDNHDNGDFTVNQGEHTVKNLSKKPAPKFILMNPLQPSYFGLEVDQVKEMVGDLSELGIGVMLVEGQNEMYFYAWSHFKGLLEELCTQYSLKGLLVEATGVYDQVEITELA